MDTQGAQVPPRRSPWRRVQLNTRVRVEIEEQLQRFVSDHGTTVQGSVDLALSEFLASRGYPPDPSRGGSPQQHLTSTGTEWA